MSANSRKSTNTENVKLNRDPRKLSSEGKSLYLLLNIEKDSSMENIRKAYRKLALQCHPDKNPGDAKAGEKFAEINHAYVVLSDEAKKDFYDKYGSLGIFMADQMGEESASLYLKLKNPCLRCLLITCCVLTGCFCCFCCCFCCRCFRKYDDDADSEPDHHDADSVSENDNASERTMPNTSQPDLILMPGTETYYHESTSHFDDSHSVNYGAADS